MAYIAHIVAGKETGPRGDSIRSEKLVDDLSNLMLLCDKHHRLIDIEDIEGHSEDKLLAMKAEHQERVAQMSSLVINPETQIILYGANINDHRALVTEDEAKLAVTKRYYPSRRAVKIAFANSDINEMDDEFWLVETKNLERHFRAEVIPLITDNECHISFFGIAPQPLLIKAGVLLGDIRHCDVYQKQREHRPTWSWVDDTILDFKQHSPRKKKDCSIALVFSISATVNNNRIQEALGSDVAIWKISVPQPHNNCMTSARNLSTFRRITRKVLNDIKAVHGEHSVINVFPVMPVSLAVEFGRTWMPKADLPLHIYDQNTANGQRGFHEVLRIQNETH